jgi:hypothetical protein
MKIKDVEEVPLSEPVPRRFVRLILNFFVGLGIGLSPFLGFKNVPFFKSLISVMPFQIAPRLIILSAFLMGIIVTAVQFYSSERISRPALRKRFAIAVITVLVGFVLFCFLRGEFAVDVERGQSEENVTALIGSTPFKYDPLDEEGCHCPDPARSPGACIQRLSFNAAAIEKCWDGREIRHRGELLGLAYLILIGGVGVLVGLIILQERARHASRNSRPRRRSREDSSA